MADLPAPEGLALETTAEERTRWLRDASYVGAKDALGQSADAIERLDHQKKDRAGC